MRVEMNTFRSKAFQYEKNFFPNVPLSDLEFENPCKNQPQGLKKWKSSLPIIKEDSSPQKKRLSIENSKKIFKEKIHFQLDS